MTWGEAKLIALQTMFSNEGEVLVEDDVNREYLNAMPGKANEALQQIAAVGRPILKSWQIQVDRDAAKPEVTADKLVLPAAKDLYKITLQNYLPRIRCLNGNEVMFEDGTAYGVAEDWRMEGDSVFVIPGDVVGVYTLWYKAYPQTITAATGDDEIIDLAPEAAVLLPLYMAAELYKEDDPALATILRNEYEDGLVKVQTAYAASGAGIRSAGVRNTTGWW